CSSDLSCPLLDGALAPPRGGTDLELRQRGRQAHDDDPVKALDLTLVCSAVVVAVPGSAGQPRPDVLLLPELEREHGDRPSAELAAHDVLGRRLFAVVEGKMAVLAMQVPAARRVGPAVRLGFALLLVPGLLLLLPPEPESGTDEQRPTDGCEDLPDVDLDHLPVARSAPGEFGQHRVGEPRPDFFRPRPEITVGQGYTSQPGIRVHPQKRSGLPEMTERPG